MCVHNYIPQLHLQFVPIVVSEEVKILCVTFQPFFPIHSMLHLILHSINDCCLVTIKLFFLAAAAASFIAASKDQGNAMAAISKMYCCVINDTLRILSSLYYLLLAILHYAIYFSSASPKIFQPLNNFFFTFLILIEEKWKYLLF